MGQRAGSCSCPQSLKLGRSGAQVIDRRTPHKSNGLFRVILSMDLVNVVLNGGVLDKNS